MIWFFIFIMLLAVGVVLLSLAYLQEEETVSRHIQFVSPTIHGVLDYIIGALLIVAPWLLGFADGGAETWVPVVLGIGIVLYSLCTDYEPGLIRRLPVPLHLVFDGVAGLFLFASPMLFGFFPNVMDPHLAFGVLIMGLALVTRPRPSRQKAPSSRKPSGKAPSESTRPEEKPPEHGETGAAPSSSESDTPDNEGERAE